MAQRLWISIQRRAAESVLRAAFPATVQFGSADELLIDPSSETARVAGRRLADRVRAEWRAEKYWNYGYENVYGTIFAALESSSPRVLEIGLGVPAPDAPSGMPADYPPCESLRVLTALLPGAEIHGADVDRRALVQDHRWSVHHVDQLDMSSMRALAARLAPLDLVIDDGLHTPEANAGTLAAFGDALAPDGLIVIEDVLPEMFPVWLRLPIPEGLAVQLVVPDDSGGGPGLILAWRRESPPALDGRSSQ